MIIYLGSYYKSLSKILYFPFECFKLIVFGAKSSQTLVVTQRVNFGKRIKVLGQQ